MSRETDVWEIDLPHPDAPLQAGHLRQSTTWAEFMREIDGYWRRYMHEHDRPESRLATKIDQRFRIDSESKQAG